jgi:mannose-1-phosphate guanylyltransferase
LAVDRVEALVPPERTWVITGKNYSTETARQLPQLAPHQIVGEPVGRDTAPCIGLGAALIARRDPEAVMLVSPADHLIEPMQEFRRAVLAAEQTAEQYPLALITFGIAPTFPSTGYGYIQRGTELASRHGISVYQVRRFEEKPKADRAEQLFVSGEYYWNSGIFVWKAATVLGALRQHRPALHAAVLRLAQAWETPEQEAVWAREYQAMERISIDYAVMQDAREVLVIRAPFRWDDVGSWLALERMHPQDADHNTILANHCGLRTDHCVIVGERSYLIATVGVKDLLIIQDGQVTLVADRQEEGNIKQLVDLLKTRGQEHYL